MADPAATTTITTTTPDEQAEILVCSMAPYWSIFAIRGLITFIFGLVILVFPGDTIVVLATIFGAFVIIDGLVFLAKSVVVFLYMPEARTSFGVLYFLTFLFSLAVGIAAIVHPEITGKVLLTVVAVWLVLIGLLELLFACLFQYTDRTASCFMALGGLLYTIVGMIFLSDLDQGILTFTKLIGAIIMVFGMQLLCVGMLLRTAHRAGRNESDAYLGGNNPEASLV